MEKYDFSVFLLKKLTEFENIACFFAAALTGPVKIISNRYLAVPSWVRLASHADKLFYEEETTDFDYYSE